MGLPAEILQPRPQMECEKASQFGAFIQVFVKERDTAGIARVSCLSYPLPPGVSNVQAREMMLDILGPQESNVRTMQDYYRSASGELQFMAREGARFDKPMQDRFLDVPARDLGINQAKRKTELIGGVLHEFNSVLQGERHESAQASKGSEIFAFSYRVDEEQHALFGKNVAGKEGKRLSELALPGDEEHADMLKTLEKRLMEIDEGVVVNFDKSKTVSLCCVKFFKEKLVKAAGEVKEAIINRLSAWMGRDVALAYVRGEDGTLCPWHNAPIVDCGCA